MCACALASVQGARGDECDHHERCVRTRLRARLCVCVCVCVCVCFVCACVARRALRTVRSLLLCASRRRRHQSVADCGRRVPQARLRAASDSARPRRVCAVSRARGTASRLGVLHARRMIERGAARTRDVSCSTRALSPTHLHSPRPHAHATYSLAGADGPAGSADDEAAAAAPIAGSPDRLDGRGRCNGSSSAFLQNGERKASPCALINTYACTRATLL
jgi:hypothetical protein